MGLQLADVISELRSPIRSSSSHRGHRPPHAFVVGGTTIGTKAAIFALIIAATFGISASSGRIWCRSTPASSRAARSHGRQPIPDHHPGASAGNPQTLILGYTFVFISVVDMTAAVAGSVGGGFGQLRHRVRLPRFNWWVTWAPS